jgi:hypothetical protein
VGRSNSPERWGRHGPFQSRPRLHISLYLQERLLALAVRLFAICLKQKLKGGIPLRLAEEVGKCLQRDQGLRVRVKVIIPR